MSAFPLSSTKYKKLTNLFLLCLLYIAAIYCIPAIVLASPDSARLDSFDTTPPPPLEDSAAKTKVEAHETKPSAETKLAGLHRLDFRILNKSCPACLLGIQKKIKCLNGVQDAAVMVRPPYGASVIYEAPKASSEYILSMVKAKEPTIKITDVSDNKIESLPMPLIPPFMPPSEPQQASLQTVPESLHNSETNK